MQLTSTQNADDPPAFALELEVEHTEAGHRWWQAIHMPKGALLELLSLLRYTAEKEGLGK